MTTEHILIALVTATVAMLMGRQWIMQGKASPRYGARWWIFMTLGRAFDLTAFCFLLAALFFLLMSI